jgi:hypothetical protein
LVLYPKWGAFFVPGLKFFDTLWDACGLRISCGVGWLLTIGNNEYFVDIGLGVKFGSKGASG